MTPSTAARSRLRRPIPARHAGALPRAAIAAVAGLAITVSLPAISQTAHDGGIVPEAEGVAASVDETRRRPMAVAATVQVVPAEIFGALAPLVGEWVPDPDSDAFRDLPREHQERMRRTVVLAFEWGDAGGQTVLLREMYAAGNPRQAEGFGIAAWNPVDQRHHYMAANTQLGFYLDGTLDTLEGGAVQRVYEISYGSDRSQIPGEDEPGWTRRFRDTYTVDGDTMEQRIEIFWQGAWRPFRGGVYQLARLTGSE